MPKCALCIAVLVAVLAACTPKAPEVTYIEAPVARAPLPAGAIN